MPPSHTEWRRLGVGEGRCTHLLAGVERGSAEHLSSLAVVGHRARGGGGKPRLRSSHRMTRGGFRLEPKWRRPTHTHTNHGVRVFKLNTVTPGLLPRQPRS